MGHTVPVSTPGIVLAIITLAFEYWYYKFKKPQSRVSSATQKIIVSINRNKRETERVRIITIALREAAKRVFF